MFAAIRAQVRLVLCAAVVLSACQRTLELPAPPGPVQPGTLQGTVVMALPGRSSRAPVAGADVWLLGTSLETKTGADGRFLLDGVVNATGTLLLRLDADHDGVFERQRQLDLDGLGGGHQVSLGEVALAQNARVEGRAVLGDKADKQGGHAGTTVYVPEGPFLTVTADDGSWSLPELPEGPIQIAFLRAGYLPQTLDGLSLRGGEELSLRPLALAPQQAPVENGKLTGKVQLVPPAQDGEKITVTAVSPTGKLVSVDVKADGSFEVDDLPPGVYAIVVSRPGYDSARIPNVAVSSGDSAAMSAPVVLERSKEPPPACTENEACESPDPCRTASTRCVSGKSVCVVSESVVDAGHSCGEGRTCTSDGRCVACEAGASCTAGNRCHVGQLDCSTGEPVCHDTGTSAPAGSVCDDGKVCDPEGECVSCAVGQSCVPADACHVGAIACDGGNADCRDLALNAPSGTSCGEDKVCNPDGRCVTCSAGAACTPANRCRLGEVSCDTGAPRCVETGAAVTAGTACGTDRVCDPTGSCVACAAGADCTPNDPCHAGKIACDSGAPVCVDTGALRSAGTTCGLGFVCSADGHCASCQQGQSCQPGTGCRKGQVDCSSGAPLCQPTQELALAGTACGSNAVCSSAGDCNACVDGQVCKPLDVCHVGQISCNTGTPRCVDTERAAPAGLACGTGKVCDPNGSCIACEEGASCTPADPCHNGKVACGSGVPVCVDQGTLRSAGTSCGQDRVCAADGKCQGCVAGASCSPQNACRTGQIACDTGAPVCQPTSALASAGTACGSNQVCSSSGTCSTCSAGASCTPQNACHQGQIACDTGAPVCQDTLAAVSAGRSCGTNQVCNPSGVCVACSAGASCTPQNACHQGKIACDTGAPVCQDQSQNVGDGTVCGTNKVCSQGSCNACTQGASCPASNPCKVGAIDCSTGTPACQDTTTNVADGTSCGAHDVCKQGACVPSGLTIVSGDAQTANVGALLQPVTLKYLDGVGNPVTNVTVTITAPAGGVSVPASGKTDLQGRLVVSLRLPRNAGSASFAAATSDGARVTISATATVPADGTIFTVVNTDHSPNNDGSGGSAFAAHMRAPRGLARASDGTLYVVDGGAHVVRKVSPEGVITTVAGTGTAGFSGDGGLATNAQLNQPTGVALDEQAGLLYVADTQNNRVRLIDLAAGTINTYAGGGSAPSPGYGDSGPAAAAVLNYPGLLAIHADPDNTPYLYVSDTGHGKIRRIDLHSSIVTTFIYGFGGNNNCAGTFQLGGCTLDWRSCGITWDAAGNAYFEQWVCGQIAGSNYVHTILRRTPQGQISHVAGRAYVGFSDGAQATQITLNAPPILTTDPAGNVYASDADANRIIRVEAATGRAKLLGGDGTADYLGDYVPMSQARFNQPTTLLLDPQGNLFVADSNNACVRQTMKVGQSQLAPARLSLVSGDGQSASPGQLLAAPFSVRLADSDGVPLSGAAVKWRSVDAGGAVYAQTAGTNAQGVVSTNARPGLRPGTYRFEASFTDLLGNSSAGSPVTFSVTANAPAQGTIFTALNTDHSSGNDSWPGAALLAHVGKLRLVTAAHDGTIYASDRDNSCVWKVTPAGQVSLVAGNPRVVGFAGDGGPATQAQFNQPAGLALSPDDGTLYVADSVNDRVRAVDLASGSITTFAGGNANAPGPGYGDSGPATAARLDRPMHVAVDSHGNVYVSSISQGRVRKVDASTGIISAYVDGASCGGAALGISSCYFYDDASCSLAFDSDDNLYVSGSVCNGAGSTVNGLLKRTPGTTGATTFFAGNTTPNTNDGIPLASTNFPVIPLPVWDGGKLFFVEPMQHRIRVYDRNTGLVSRFAGTGAMGYAGDFVPALQAQFNRPVGMAVLPSGGGRYVVSDGDNACLRIVW